MDHREIILQMEERKYDALRRALLARDTDPRAEMQEWLNVCYRELVPQQERELIEKQINEERQPGLSEAGTQPKFNVFRVIERGECHCFQVNDASVDALEIANRLYGYLSRETVGFAEQFEGWTFGAKGNAVKFTPETFIGPVGIGHDVRWAVGLPSLQCH